MIIDWQLATWLPWTGDNISITIISLGYSFSITFFWTVVGIMGRTIIACLQLFRYIHFRAMNDTVKFAGNLACLPQGGSTAYLLYAKQPAVQPSSIRSLLLLRQKKPPSIYFLWQLLYLYLGSKSFFSLLLNDSCNFIRNHLHDIKCSTHQSNLHNVSVTWLALWSIK